MVAGTAKRWPVIVAAAIGLLLLAATVSHNAQAKDINQALLDAARDGKPAEIDRLLDEGADINAQNAKGWTGLMFAVTSAHLKLAKKLLEKGADPNAAAAQGVTPLMKAVEQNDASMVQLLLENGASMDAMDDAGKTPMDYAKGKSHKEVKKLLLKHEAAQ